MDSIWGECPHGYIVAPGHTANEKHSGIYRTIQAHVGLMTSFNSRDIARRQDSRTTQIFKKDKESPDFKLSLTSEIGNIVRHVKDDQEVIEMWPVPVPCTRADFRFKKNSDGTLTPILRPSLTHDTNVTHLYPGLNEWNCAKAHFPKMKSFLISFAGLAFIHNECSGGDVLSLGLDADTFEEFDQWLSQWLTSPIVRYIKTNTPEAGASMLAFLVGLPEGWVYPIVKSTKIEKGTLTFFTYSPKRKVLVDTLLKAGVTPVDAHGIIQEMTWAPLHKKGANPYSMYDRVMINLEAGHPWYMGFEILQRGQKFLILASYL